MVGKRPHGLQQELSDGAQQSHWHPGRQVLLGQVEDAGAGCQLHVERSRVILHAQNYQLEEQNTGEADEELLPVHPRRNSEGFYLEDVWSRLFHDVRQAEQVKQGFSHEPFPLAVASQGFTDLRLVCFACYLRGQTSTSHLDLNHSRVLHYGDSCGQNL